MTEDSKRNVWEPTFPNHHAYDQYHGAGMVWKDHFGSE